MKNRSFIRPWSIHKASLPKAWQGGRGLRAFLAAGVMVSVAMTGMAETETELTTTEPTVQQAALTRDSSVDDIFTAMFGTKQHTAAQLSYPVLIVGVNVGDVDVTPSNDGSAVIERKPLMDLLLPILTGDKQIEVLQTFKNDKTVTTTQLSAIGLEARFNNTSLALEVNVPLEYRAIVPIPLQRRRDPSETLEILPQAKTSAIVNVVGGSSYVHSSEFAETGFSNTQVNIEAAINHNGLVFETSARYVETGESKFQRGDTRITKDFVESQIRVEAGDLSVPTSGLQGNPRLAGIAGFRHFRLKPYEEFRANPSQQFELQRPARVSVYINNQFVRELRLAPGRYNLTDLPLRSAAGNDVTLEILYDSGDIDRVVFSAFYDFNLLKKGVSEFAVNAGPTSQLVEGELEYDTDNIAFSGFYRKGVSDRMTLGANAQADSDLVSIGGEALYATSVGSFGVLGSYSDHDQGSGGALTGLYRWNGTNVEKQSRFSFQAQYQDPEYRALGTNSGGRFKYDISARASQNITKKIRLQGSANWRKRHDRDDFDQSYSVLLNRQLGRGTLSANVRYEDTQDDGEVWSAGIGYTLRIGKGLGQFAHNTRNHSTRASYGFQPREGVGNWGYDIAYTRQQQIDELRAGIGYIGNRFDGRIEQRISNSNPDENFGSENRTDIFGGTALVYADGKMALSRPVFDSFAIFDTNTDAKDFKIAVDPQVTLFGTSGNYAAKSSALGAAVVPDLQSYYVRTIQVEAPDAPAGTSIGSDAYSLKPSYRGGYVIKVGNDRNAAVISRLILPSGEPVKFASGYAITEEGERIQMFTNGGGRFYVEGLKPGERIRIEFDVPNGMVAEFTVPDGSVGVVRLNKPITARPGRSGPPPSYEVVAEIFKEEVASDG